MTQTQIETTYNTLCTIRHIQTEPTEFRIVRADIANINAIIQRYGRTYRAAALVRRYLAALEA